MASKILRCFKYCWTLCGSIIIAGVHTLIHIPFAARISFLGYELPVLFFIPLFVSVIVGILIEVEELTHVLYANMFVAVFAIFLIGIILFSPALLGGAIFSDIFVIWLIQRLLVSFILTFIAVIIGSLLVGLFIAE